MYFRNSYQRLKFQLELLAHHYDMLRNTYEKQQIWKTRILQARQKCNLPMTKEEEMGYGNYEKRCLIEVKKTLEN